MVASGAAPTRGRATADPILDKRQVNRLVREGLEALDPTEPIAFFCECGESGCIETVRLTGREYDDGKTEPGWVALARGHRPAADAAGGAT